MITLRAAATPPTSPASPSRSSRPKPKAAMAKEGSMLPNGMGRKTITASSTQTAPMKRSAIGP